MTNEERKVIELALEWIENQPEETPHSKYDLDTRYVVIREIEAALAQQRTWVWLPDDERDHIIEHYGPDLGALVNRIQVRAKELNT